MFLFGIIQRAYHFVLYFKLVTIVIVLFPGLQIPTIITVTGEAL